VDGIEQVALNGIETDSLAQPGGEGGHHRLGVVVRPVEPPVDRALDSPAERVNSAAAASVAAAATTGVLTGRTTVARITSPANTPASTAVTMA
jgi:hypothetical protein